MRITVAGKASNNADHTVTPWEINICSIEPRCCSVSKNLHKNDDFEAVKSWYNVFDYCTEENRLEIMMLAIEKKALEDFQDMMSTLESDLS